MAQYKNSGLDSKSLAEKKSKRLEEALSAYTPEQTKQTVSKLLEEFVDDDGKNYFGAGNRDTTLYFADDEYIREIEKEKAKDREKQKHHKEEKTSVVEKLHKLTSILPKAEHHEDEKPLEDEEAVTVEKFAEEPVVEEKSDEKEIAAETENIKEETAEETHKDTEKEEEISAQEPEKAEEEKAEMPEPEPTIVITPVKAEASKKEDTEEMRREFFDDEVEVESVPRRRRKQAEVPAEEEKKAPEINIDDVDDEDYDDDFEEEKEEKKSKFGNFFKRKNSDPFEDDEFDDDEFDDDDYYDDDEYDDYDEGGSVFKKVLNAVVIIALVCSTAFFAASNYSNIKKLESANTQINELNNGTSGTSDEEINELKAKVDALTAENEKLKNGGTAQTSEPTSASQTGTASTTITGTAPSGEGSSTGSASGSTYTIKAGDTGSKICKAVYGQYTEEAWQKILDANGMTASSVYHPGDVLQIP